MDAAKSNKQKFLEFISKAYDKGLTIDITDYSHSVSENEAKDMVEELSQITGISFKRTEFSSTQAFVLGELRSKVRGHFYYGPVTFLEEDVDLSGREVM